ncbi:IS30 family transposase [Epibacterium mobile]|uniref:IS30 family transposase n=1 Tax=Tritonibacter mobilis TaxID=379347 RepID=UPI001CD985DA|nr:IS30 family transposase [Tritonibacter mobilis]MCA2008285.1 IS30 family transposase [Tritonibacter mobilis]
MPRWRAEVPASTKRIIGITGGIANRHQNTPAGVGSRRVAGLEPLSAQKSITFDRGFEFRAWRKLKSGIGADSWFCDLQAPWQKGTVENLNKRARRYLPRDTQLAALSNRDMKAICDRLNGALRKCLGWRTPHEAFREEIMKLR